MINTNLFKPFRCKNLMEEPKNEEKDWETKKKTRINLLAPSYYSRKDIQQAIFEFCKDREVVPRYFEGFGKRPDTLEYPSDVINQVKKGATSFHCSEELWQDPLQLSKELSQQELDSLRKGWDLVIDIDSKYFDYSKIMANLVIKALNFHGVKNVGVKFSGSKGFHILVPWKAFPMQIYEQEIKKMFPEFPKAISLYLHELIKPELIHEITNLTGNKSYVKDFESAEKVAPDIVLVSSRHLFRCPYSLHEKTGLASIVINPDKLTDFQAKDADPLKVKVISYMPEPKENEARELLLQALDWNESKKNEKKSENEKKYKKFHQIISIDKSRIVFPPCINNILKGIEDGKKRALFILLNYFHSLNFTKQETEEKIQEWNIKNKKPLLQGYVNSQLEYSFKNKQVLPPNCDKSHYKDISVCVPDELCKLVKNPINYTIRKTRFNKYKKI